MRGNFPAMISFFGFPLSRYKFPRIINMIMSPRERRDTSRCVDGVALHDWAPNPLRAESFLAVRTCGWQFRAKSLVTKGNSGFAGRFAVLGARVRTRMRPLQQAIRIAVPSMGITIVPGFSRSHEMWR